MKKTLFLFFILLGIAGVSVMIYKHRHHESDAADFRDWALTPPMGWNSWDCYGPTVTEKEVMDNADYMARHLASYGWEYVVVDIRWFVENDKAGGYNQDDPVYVMDEYGRYLPAANRFPSGFKALGDYIHGLGLKFGIHIMRGIPVKAVNEDTPVLGAPGISARMIYSPDNQCKWLRDNYSVDMSKSGAQEYYNSIIQLYASWGVDFIKCDDLSAPIYHKEEIEALRKAIDFCGRPIVLSTSPGATPYDAAEHVSSHANMWRMVDDVWDHWWYIPHLIETAENWYPWIGGGTWPDCDMIPLGRISIRGERGEDRLTRLTPDEQYTLMSLFCILRSPLMFGGDLPSMDPFTLSLLTNREVLRMHRESSEVRQLYRKGGVVAITSVNSKSGDRYLAIFNLTEEDAVAEIPPRELELSGAVKVTDLWTDRPETSRLIELKAHQSRLLMICPNTTAQ